jgi:hypothetical protein
MDVNGPLFKRANMLQAISGATSYEIMRRDLQAAADAGVHALIMNIDSPGGEASGMHELAQAVYDMRGTMHITAYVGGSGHRPPTGSHPPRMKSWWTPPPSLAPSASKSPSLSPRRRPVRRSISSFPRSPRTRTRTLGTEAAAPKSSKPLTRWRKFSWSPSHAIAAWLLKRSLQTSAKAASSLARRRWRPDWRTPSVPLRRSSRTSPQGTAARNQRESRQPWPTKLPSPRSSAIAPSPPPLPRSAAGCRAHPPRHRSQRDGPA